MIFEDRADAARQLAVVLKDIVGPRPLVLGIPRGAVPMARVIADALGADMDVVLVRKLPAPGEPEFAIGSVSEAGEVYLSPMVQSLGIPDAYIREETGRQRNLILKRRRMYGSPPGDANPRGREVIVVDDGLATGATMISALRAVRKLGPRRLIAAAAVAPPDTVDRMRDEADRVVCLHTPDDFLAVGRFFRRFEPVTDQEVARILKSGASPREPRTAETT